MNSLYFHARYMHGRYWHVEVPYLNSVSPHNRFSHKISRRRLVLACLPCFLPSTLISVQGNRSCLHRRLARLCKMISTVHTLVAASSTLFHLVKGSNEGHTCTAGSLDNPNYQGRLCACLCLEVCCACLQRLSGSLIKSWISASVVIHPTSRTTYFLKSELLV